MSVTFNVPIILACVLVLFSCVPLVESATSKEGLVAEWTFDEGQGEVARDSSGRGNDLALRGANWVKQGNGFAINLDGLGGYAECPLTDSLRSSNAITVEAWIKPTAIGWVASSVFGISEHDYLLGYSNRGEFWWYVSSGTNQVGGKAATGAWNHVIATFDGKTRTMWINGRPTETHPTNLPRGIGDRFLVGSATSPSFNGSVDHLRIYNRAFAPAEVIASFRDEAVNYGIDPTWFSKIKIQPYYYFDKGEVVVELDYAALLPLHGKGQIELVLANADDTKVVLQKTLDSLPSKGIVEINFPIADLPPARYAISAVLHDEETTFAGDPVRFQYPPESPKIPSPSQRIAKPLPAAAASAPFQVEVHENGSFHLIVNGVRYPFITKVSWPNGQFNQLPIANGATSEASWKPTIRKIDENHYEMGASGDFYSLRREIEVLPTHVNIKDTYTNKTDEDLGLLIYNELPLDEKQMTGSRLCGYEGGGRSEDVLSPHHGGASIFVKDNNTGIGMLPMDDVYNVQSLLYIEKNISGMATEKFALAPKSAYTLMWAVYPTPTGDYYDFINTFRRVEGRIGTVHGGLGFISYGPANRRQIPNREFLDLRGTKVGIISALTRSADDPGLSLEGIEFTDFPEEMRLLKEQTSALHAQHPDLKVVFHIAHTLYCTNKPDRFADSKLMRADGTQAASGGSPPFTKEHVANGWAWYVYYPTPGNSFHEALMKSVDVMMDEMGVDGAFVDGFMLGYGGRWTYDRWDGHSAEIDKTTKTITRKMGSVLLLMQPSMIEYARKIHDKGGIVIANGNVVTPTLAKEKYLVFDAECQSGPECHLAPNALSLSLPPFDSEKEIYLDVLDKLSWGMLYMYYNERIPVTHPSLPAKQFPITFEEMRPGLVRGRQRIITMNSGTYEWPGERNLHKVFKFDGRGAPMAHAFVTTVDSGGVRTELAFAEHESAVIEPIPVTLASNAPVNVLVRAYDGNSLALEMHGQGDVTLNMFVGTDYQDWREGVFTDGGVNPADVGAGRKYRVTVGDKTMDVQERDGTLLVPLQLNGQTSVTIQHQLEQQ